MQASGHCGLSQTDLPLEGDGGPVIGDPGDQVVPDLYGAWLRGTRLILVGRSFSEVSLSCPCLCDASFRTSRTARLKHHVASRILGLDAGGQIRRQDDVALLGKLFGGEMRP